MVCVVFVCYLYVGNKLFVIMSLQKPVAMHIYMSVEDKERLKYCAEELRISQSELVRKLINDKYKELQK